MLIEIIHRTSYRYAAPVHYTVQSLRLRPPEFEGQKVLSWEIKAPGIETAVGFDDCFGNRAVLTTLQGPHEGIDIEAFGVVETSECIGVVRGIADPAPLRVFQRHTQTTEADGSIAALARACDRRDTLSTLHELMRTIAESVRYEIGTTQQSTTAIEALARGTGVCQDHAHILIAAARCLGIPARYVNGYFLSGTLAPSEAHHAWAEAWVEGLGWVGFDPANRCCPTERYVRLACGLDAQSAAPIRGTQRGGTNERLDVTVEVQQQGSQQ